MRLSSMQFFRKARANANVQRFTRPNFEDARSGIAAAAYVRQIDGGPRARKARRCDPARPLSSGATRVCPPILGGAGSGGATDGGDALASWISAQIGQSSSGKPGACRLRSPGLCSEAVERRVRNFLGLE